MFLRVAVGKDGERTAVRLGANTVLFRTMLPMLSLFADVNATPDDFAEDARTTNLASDVDLLDSVMLLSSILRIVLYRGYLAAGQKVSVLGHDIDSLRSENSATPQLNFRPSIF